MPCRFTVLFSTSFSTTRNSYLQSVPLFLFTTSQLRNFLDEFGKERSWPRVSWFRLPTEPHNVTSGPQGNLDQNNRGTFPRVIVAAGRLPPSPLSGLLT